MHYLVSRANNPPDRVPRHPADVPQDGQNEEISGHALMATCPPPTCDRTHATGRNAFEAQPVSKAGLARLFGLSEKLPGLGREELPPIKAWVKLRNDARFPRLNATDFHDLRTHLTPVVKCLRYVAVRPFIR